MYNVQNNKLLCLNWKVHNINHILNSYTILEQQDTKEHHRPFFKRKSKFLSLMFCPCVCIYEMKAIEMLCSVLSIVTALVETRGSPLKVDHVPYPRLRPAVALCMSRQQHYWYCSGTWLGHGSNQSLFQLAQLVDTDMMNI